MNHTDARGRQNGSPPVIRSKRFDSPVDSAVAAFSAHTSAVINAEGEVSKLISKRVHAAPLHPEETAVLSVQREFRDTNKYSVGLLLSDEPPYIVNSVAHLKDSSGEAVNGEVSVGDKLHKIGNHWVGQASVDIVEELLSGEKNSVVELILEDASTREIYAFFAQYHVPLTTERTPVQRFHVKDHVQDGILVAESSVVDVLEDLREEASTARKSVTTLLQFGQQAQTSLGIRVAFRWNGSYVSSGTVEEVVAGSTSDPVIKIGDEVISVNGKEIAGQDHAGVLQIFRGDDTIGSRCELEVKRKGTVMRAEVRRTSAFCNKDAEKLMEHCYDLDSLIKTNAAESSLRNSLQRVVSQAILIEHRRGLKETLVAARLADLQDKIVGSVLTAQALLSGASDHSLKRLRSGSTNFSPTRSGSSRSAQPKQTPFVPGKTLMESMQERDIGAVDLLAIVQTIPVGTSVDELLSLLGMLQAPMQMSVDKLRLLVEQEEEMEGWQEKLQSKIVALEDLARMERLSSTKAHARAAELQRRLQERGDAGAAHSRAVLLTDESGAVSASQFRAAMKGSRLDALHILQILEAMGGGEEGVPFADVLEGIGLLRGPPRRSVESLLALVRKDGEAENPEDVIGCLHAEIMRMQADFARMTTEEQEMRERSEAVEAELNAKIEALEAENRQLLAQSEERFKCPNPLDHEEVGRLQGLLHERDEQNEALAHGVRSMQRSVEQVTEERETLRDKVRGLESKVDAMEGEASGGRTAAEASIAALREELALEQADRKKVEAALADLERERGAREERLRLLEEQASMAAEVAARREEEAQEAIRLRTEKQGLEGLVKTLEMAKAAAEEQVRQLKHQTAMLERDKEMLQREHTSAMHAPTRAQAETMALLQEFEAKVSALEAEGASRKEELDNLNAELDRHRSRARGMVDRAVAEQLTRRGQEKQQLQAEVMSLRQESAKLDDSWRREQAETSYSAAKVSELAGELDRQAQYTRQLEDMVERLKAQAGSQESAWAQQARRNSPAPAGAGRSRSAAPAVSARQRRGSSDADSPLPPPTRWVHAQSASPGPAPSQQREVAYSVSARHGSAPPPNLGRATPPPSPENAAAPSASMSPPPGSQTSPPSYIALPYALPGSPPFAALPSVSSAGSRLPSSASAAGMDGRLPSSFSRASASPSSASFDSGLVGVGLLLRKGVNSKTVTIKEVVADGAAAKQRADVKVGDRLLFVNGKSVEGLGLSQVLELVKGPRGTRCSLTLSREHGGGGTAVFAVDVTRHWDGLANDSPQRPSSRHSWTSSVHRSSSVQDPDGLFGAFNL